MNKINKGKRPKLVSIADISICEGSPGMNVLQNAIKACQLVIPFNTIKK